MGAEGACGSELAELVPDHRLRHVNGNVLAAVVHGDRVSDHVGDHRGEALPRLDDALLVLLVHLGHLDQQVVVDERAFLKTARHLLSTSLLAAPADDHLVRRLLLARPALGLTPRGDGVTSTGRLALSTTQRVVDRVHSDASNGGTLVLPASASCLADRDQLGLGIADLAYRRSTLALDH